MIWSPFFDRHLHADHDSFLADVEVAEAADQAHAIQLAGLFLETADQQHLAVGVNLLVTGEFGGTSAFCAGLDREGQLLPCGTG